MRSLVLLFLAVSALAPAAGAQEGPMLHMIEFRYLPDPIRVAPGTEVIAMNFDEEPHSVTSSTDRSLFDLRDIPPGGEARTFVAPTTPGTYPYYCIYHGTPDAGMRGTLVVEAAASSPPPATPPEPTPTTATPPPATPPEGPADGTPLAAWVALVALGLVALLRRTR